MKLALITVVAAVAVSNSIAADVNVIGARSTTSDLPAAMAPSIPSMRGAATADANAAVNVIGAETPATPTAKDVDIRIAAKDLLNRPTGLLNKNTLAMDNNVFIARSNIVFTQNDRLAMRKKVEDVVMKQDQNDSHEQSVTTATLTKDVMRAVSAPDTDAALMTKASAVVVAKGDASALSQRIADFVDAAGKREMDEEQAVQSQTPSGVVVLVGTKDLLRQPTGVVNKNVAMSDNQITISRSNLAPTQNDQVVMAGGAKVADAILPAAAVNVGKVNVNEAADAGPAMYRQAFMYPKTGEATQKQELWGLGGIGWGFGWRYPLGYWNSCGAGLYGGGGCGLGLGFGGYYYC